MTAATQLQEVQLIPVLDEHAVPDAPYVDRPHFDFAAGHPVGHVVGTNDEILQGSRAIGQDVEECGPEAANGFAFLSHRG